MTGYDEVMFDEGEIYQEEPEQQEQNTAEEPEEPEEVEPEEPEELDGEDDDEEEDPKATAPSHYVDSDEEVEKARAGGWTPYEEWVKQGKPPGEWKTARHFNEVGELYNNLRSQKKESREEIEATKLLMDMQVNELKSKQEALNQSFKEAVESGNLEEAQRITNQINQNTANQYLIQSQQNNSEVQKLRESEANWQRQNTWFNLNDPNDPNYAKSSLLNVEYDKRLRQGIPFEQAMSEAERIANQAFPPSNPARDKPGVTDGKQSPRNKGTAKSFDELPPEAKREFEKFSEVWTGKDAKKNFTKAWNNSKKGS